VKRSAIAHVAAVLAAALFLFTTAARPTADAEERPYLEAALRTAEWISASSISGKEGTAWPVDPLEPQSIVDNLYSGNPGVVLFFLEAWNSTGNDRYLHYARSGADRLLAVLEGEEENGLYVGLAGIGFVLCEVGKATGETKYRDGAARCVQLIRERAKGAGAGIEWGGGTTDILNGAAGTGLFLLYAADALEAPACLELAVAAGRRLVEVGIPVQGGLKWAMDPEFPRLMPNFSHGTAGVAYFLATLYARTGEQFFLDAALAGACYLQSVAITADGVSLIFHHEPGGEDLFYLGWCHGPVGTARLFYELYRVTGEEKWMEWVRRCADAIFLSGIPEKRTPGFWNNVGICCGSAGVAEFFLDLHRITGEEEYLKFCKRMTADMLARATPAGDGIKWIQAEHRIRPDFLVAQTGYMQGAAGIGTFLLYLDAFERGKSRLIRLPDTPF